MSRSALPYGVPDVSALAKSLRTQLAGRSKFPSHVEMLNMLARATGSRNFQHWRLVARPASMIVPAPAPPQVVDEVLVLRAARYFVSQGWFASWPARTKTQSLCLWAIWARIPPQQIFNEQAMNVLLNGHHLFNDPAILRRSLWASGLVTRTPDGREYRRIERPPPPEALLLIARLKDRLAAR